MAEHRSWVPQVELHIIGHCKAKITYVTVHEKYASPNRPVTISDHTAEHDNGLYTILVITYSCDGCGDCVCLPLKVHRASGRRGRH